MTTFCCNLWELVTKVAAAAVARFKMLGSIDSNTGSPDLGWDTDQFPMDMRHTTLVMKVQSAQLFPWRCPVSLFTVVGGA